MDKFKIDIFILLIAYIFIYSQAVNVTWIENSTVSVITISITDSMVMVRLSYEIQIVALNTNISYDCFCVRTTIAQ